MRRLYRYLIVGGGLAGISAAEEIRKRDRYASIGLLCAEEEPPYNRPPLSKDLLWGKKRLNQIFIHDKSFYRQQQVELHLNTRVKSLNREERYVTDEKGNCYGYSTLLLATGGAPRKPEKAGEWVHTLHTAGDYLELELAMATKQEFLVIGGGFIGVELAAGLAHQRKRVTVVTRGPALFSKVFPPDLAAFVTDYYRKKDVAVITEDEAMEFLPKEGRVVVRTQKGKTLEAEWAVAGMGLVPGTELAEKSGLAVKDGILTNRFLQTSDPAIFAAGDLARFPCEAVGSEMRVEHWDNARAQGLCAGVNMAGGDEPYVYLPYFYSDLFDLGFEAVGKLDSRMLTYAWWDEPLRKGVVAYLDDQKVRGVLLWNNWGKVEWARKLILEQAYLEFEGDLKPVLSGAQSL